MWLITGQDPADTNREVAPGPDDAALPHMTIFTEFGDLTLPQKVTVFKRCIIYNLFRGLKQLFYKFRWVHTTIIYD